MPPPIGHYEACTLENATRPGEECILHTEWAFARAAPEYLGSAGFCRRCRTYGATYAGVMYCRPKVSAKPLPLEWEKGLPQDPTPHDGDPPLRVAACPLTPEESSRVKTFTKLTGCACSI